MIKILFTGDMMALTPENRAALNNGVYDYNPVFSKIAPIFREAHYVVGNLETPIGGEDLIYTSEDTVFNTPSEFAKAAVDAGFKCFSLANNHCLDRGIEGLNNTIDYLDSIGVAHVGAYKLPADSNEVTIVEVGKKKIALLSFTYGTNSEWQNNKLSETDIFRIDLIREQNDFKNIRINPNIQKIKGMIKKILPQSIREKIRPIVIDSCVKNGELFDHSTEYYRRFAKKIENAREKADYVVMLLHCGGQYNSKVDDYTRSVCRSAVELGCDLVVTNHPHVILPYEKYKGKYILYSLGNFCFTPGFGYYYKGVYADYSAVLSLYFEDDGCYHHANVQFYKSIVEKSGHSVVYPLYDLIKSSYGKKKHKLLLDLNEVLFRFFGRDTIYLNKVLPEYHLS